MVDSAFRSMSVFSLSVYGFCFLLFLLGCFLTFASFQLDLHVPLGLHCNYSDRELWIVRDRSSGHIWQVDSVWYYVFCWEDEQFFVGGGYVGTTSR